MYAPYIGRLAVYELEVQPRHLAMPMCRGGKPGIDAIENPKITAASAVDGLSN